VKFIPSDVSFVLKLIDENCIKSVDFDKVSDKNKLASFYGSRCTCMYALPHMQQTLS